MQCYMAVLTTWKRVTVTPRTLHSISLVVLRSATELEFRRSSLVKEKFLLTHWRYLFDKMEASRRLDVLIMNTSRMQDWNTLDKAIFGYKGIRFDQLRRIEVPSNRCDNLQVSGQQKELHGHQHSLLPPKAPRLEEVIRWPLRRLFSWPDPAQPAIRIEELQVYDRGDFSTCSHEWTIGSFIQNQPLRILRLETFDFRSWRKKTIPYILNGIVSCHATLQELLIGVDHRRRDFPKRPNVISEDWRVGSWNEFCDSISQLTNLKRFELILPIEQLFKDELLTTILLSLQSLRFVHFVVMENAKGRGVFKTNLSHLISTTSINEFCGTMASLLPSTRIRVSIYDDNSNPYYLPRRKVDWRATRDWIEARGEEVIGSPELRTGPASVLVRVLQGFRAVMNSNVEEDS